MTYLLLVNGAVGSGTDMVEVLVVVVGVVGTVGAMSVVNVMVALEVPLFLPDTHVSVAPSLVSTHFDFM